jgi:hypothetical protein
MSSYLFLIINIILKQCDVMYSFINNPQQRLYTIARLE